MSKPKSDVTRVAVIQATPVLFNKSATLDKTLALIKEASQNEPDLIIFPESFIPAYPRNMQFGTVIGSRSEEGRELWELYHNNSIIVPGSDTEQLAKSAKEAGAYVSLGITEKDGKSLYCTQLFFTPGGRMAGKHRKLKPTAAERIIWGEGDGRDLVVFDTANGMISTLICWENYMPMARMSMYRKGINIHLAPTADNRKSWQTTIKHIAMEGRCFVISCNQFVKAGDYPENMDEIDRSNPELIVSSGGSAVISPFGEYVAGPVWDKEEILYADLDMSMITRASFDFDPAGHYNRNDIFDLKVNGQPEVIKC